MIRVVLSYSEWLRAEKAHRRRELSRMAGWVGVGLAVLLMLCLTGCGL